MARTPKASVVWIYRERGALHAPEFTMLEWYRPHFDANALMDEVEELVTEVRFHPEFHTCFLKRFQQLFAGGEILVNEKCFGRVANGGVSPPT